MICVDFLSRVSKRKAQFSFDTRRESESENSVDRWLLFIASQRVWEQNVHQSSDSVCFLNRHVYTQYTLYVLVPTLSLFSSRSPSASHSLSFSRGEESDAEVLHFCLCKCLSEVQLGKIWTATLVLKQKAVQHGRLMTGDIIYQITQASMCSGSEDSGAVRKNVKFRWGWNQWSDRLCARRP